MDKTSEKKSKKLTLSAETLRNLSEPDLQQVAGGVQTRMCSILVCTFTSPCCE